MRKVILAASSASLLLALLVTYSNHFQNSFHFDDAHAVVANPWIRDLRDLPKIFTDASTFSTLPANQSYRPIVTASLAIDYWLGKGLQPPLWFHVTTFLWFVVQLVLMCLLFAKVMNMTLPGSQNIYLALFATAWYGLHPVMAETVNYIIQRGDLYSTLGIVAGLVIYCYWPRARKFGIYLLPVAIGSLAKPAALIFPAILFVYVLLFEGEQRQITASREKGTGKLKEGNIGEQAKNTPSSAVPRLNIVRALRAALPAIILTAASGLFQAQMTPKTWVSGASSRTGYWMTQPMVWLHYFKSFFLPTELSADTDRQVVTSLWSEASVVGLAFVCVLIYFTRKALRRPEMRPAAFGLLWFIVGLIPTSLTPLAEVENDHRMFLPFVGLVLAVTWAAAVFLNRKTGEAGNGLSVSPAVAAIALCILGAYAYGTHGRNEVWHSEESLWKDVAEKSPRNGRGLMNYGLTLMGRGDDPGALRYYHDAEFYTPNYSLVHINEAVAFSAIGNDAEADRHFHQALALAPNDAQSYYFFARWQKQKGKLADAATNLQTAILLNPALLDPRYLLMQIYLEQNDAAKLKELAQQTLSLFPDDRTSANYLASANNPNRKAQSAAVLAPQGSSDAVANAELAVKQNPTADNYIDLSMVYEQAGRHQDCIAAAKNALKLRPDYPEAYNNIAAANQAIGNWDEAIQAAQKAVQLRPDFQLAKNNLAYSLNQKRLRDSAGKH